MFNPVRTVPAGLLVVLASTPVLNALVPVKFCGEPELKRAFKLPTTSGNVLLGVIPNRFAGQLAQVIRAGKPDWNVVKPPIPQLPTTCLNAPVEKDGIEY